MNQDKENRVREDQRVSLSTSNPLSPDPSPILLVTGQVSVSDLSLLLLGVFESRRGLQVRVSQGPTVETSSTHTKSRRGLEVVTPHLKDPSRPFHYSVLTTE